MASTSSSHRQNAFSGIEPPNKRRKIEESSRVYEVFINHRGPDVKTTLATELYNSIKALGISAFLDSEEKELGNSFTSIIEAAVRSASVHIAIFSKRYAESAWCLAELDLMLQTKSKIIPVFYQVEPWELRYIEKGMYAEAFRLHQEKGRYLDKLEDWKEAIQKISYTAGVLINPDCIDCKDIVSAVEKEVKRKQHLYVAKHPVGLHKLVGDFERQCLGDLVKDFERNFRMKKTVKGKANVVGIFGMGGVGKTTLSKELYNQKISKYTKASFLFDVREACTSGRLPSLQSKLLKDIFGEDRDFHSSEEGTSRLRYLIERSSSLSFLIVLDDIDHVEQLESLLVMDMLKKFDNNLVIITTRNVGVLVSAGIDIGYHLKELAGDDGRELFCWHAFNQPHPHEGYEDLVQNFLNVCGGLPLSLIVLGRHVFGRERWYWQDELEKVKETLPTDIKHRLKISIDRLDDVEKQIFMDIACFFNGHFVTAAMLIWKGSGWRARRALETLKERCLIEEYKFPCTLPFIVFRMHDHLRDLGREMADELSNPHRVWRAQDLKSLESNGFQNILTHTKSRTFHSTVDKSIGCEISYFLGKPKDGSDASLLWLQLEYLRRFRLDLNLDINSAIPSWVPLQNLQCLSIRYGCFQKLWQSDVEAPSRKTSDLKRLVIEDCPALEELPSPSELNCLEEIEIRSCEKLKNIRLPTKLSKLAVYGCTVFQGIEGTSDLKRLVIKDCPALEELPSPSELNCLEEIEIRSCEKLQNIRLPTTLSELVVDGCTVLQGIEGTSNLKRLVIKECPALEELPSPSELNCLEEIEIRSCEKLQNIRLPTTLSKLNVNGCTVLQGIAGIAALIKLTRLCIAECPALELPCLGIEKIEIDSCNNLQNNISAAEELHVPEYTRLRNCCYAVTRYFIDRWKSLPRRTCLIGKAVDGAESSLNLSLFSEANIAVNGVTEITDPEELYPDSDNFYSGMSIVIVWLAVAIDSSNSAEDSDDLKMRQGESLVVEYIEYNEGETWQREYRMWDYKYLQGFRVDLEENEKWKSMRLLHTIVDRLYDKE